MMRLEFLLCALGLAATVACFFSDDMTRFQIFLPAAILILLLLHLWATPFRWQILPIWFVLILTQAIILLNLNVRGFTGFVLLGFCAASIVLALILVMGMPLFRLPVPDGRFGVGSIAHTFVDSDRALFESSTRNGRRILVKVWYPSDVEPLSNDDSKEVLWQDLYGAEDVPKSLRWFTSYLRSVHTNTVYEASFATGVENPQLLLYNHGMISTASENTTLMEHLASHGYVVLSIQHLDQLAEFNALNAEVPETERKKNKALMKRLTSSIGRDERAEVSFEYFRSSSAMNRIVAARAKDTEYVLNNATELFAKIPSLEKDALSVDRVGLLGFSFGGAVSTEYSKNYERCEAVVNMDGGLYGTQIEEPVPVPYLMMYSEQNEGSNDLVLKNATAEVLSLVMPQTKHLDFHDAKLVFPILRWMGPLGRVSSQEFLVKKNEAIRKHFEAFLAQYTPTA